MKFPGKRRGTTAPEIPIETPENEYYEAISERFGIAQVILYLALLAFVALSLLANTGLITYQNLYYFIKDLNASAETVDVIHSDAITYPASTSQSFALYRKGLAVAGSHSVTVFTPTGRQALSKNIQYQNPVAVGSGKYLLVYELGGTQYSLYNSYTQIYSGKTDTPIRGGAMSSSGMYALISQAAQHPSVVELFNSDFEQINRYTYHSYVADVSISDKGSYLAVLTSATENAAFDTTVRFYEPGKAELTSEVHVSGSLGLSCRFTDSGDLAILCGNGVYYADVRGKLGTEHDFNGKTIVCAELDADGCAVVLKKNSNSSENEIFVFDKSGKMLYNEVITEAVGEVAVYKTTVYAKLADGILRINTSDGARSKTACSTEQRTMLAVDGSRVLLCSPQKAVYVRFG